MKPIRLKIKGVNSFVEPCEIDFEELSSKGLFGIFGPTGSGKSTILDGMTLALYGEIPRNTKLFVNNRSQSAAVSFEFQISGAVNRRYKVDREFKKNEGGGKQTGKVRLVEIGEEEVVLADKATKVNEEITKIIGLTKDDFSRTVVLPQGKFSEFLKLEGSEKREMLERIFDLQKYGEQLTGKINYHLGATKTSYNTLEGYLRSFDDLKDFDLESEESRIQILKEEKAALEKKLSKEVEIFEEIKVQYNKQLELYKKEEELESLEKEKDDWVNLEEKIVKSEKIGKEIPYVNGYIQRLKEARSIVSQVKNTKEEIAKKEENLKAIQLRQNKSQEDLINHQGLVVQKEEIIKGINPNKEARDILIEIKGIEKSIDDGNKITSDKVEELTATVKQKEGLEKGNVDIETKIKELGIKDETLSKRLEDSKKELEVAQTANLADSIAHSLHEGEDCPVCGNVYKGRKSEFTADITAIKTEIKEIEGQQKALRLEDTKVQSLKGANRGAISTLELNVESLSLSLTKYKKRLDELESIKNGQLEKLRGVLGLNKEKELDIKKELERIQGEEKKKDSLQEEVNNLRAVGEKLNRENEKLKELFVSANTDLLGMKAVLKQQELQIENCDLALEIAKIDLEKILGKSIEDVDFKKDFEDHYEDSQIEKWKKMLSAYHKSVIEVTGKIEELKSHIKKVITAAMFEEFKGEIDEKNKAIQVISKELVIEENSLKEKIKRKEEERICLKEFQGVESKMKMLEELKKLFAGKRFVSYVAGNQLSYISKEASRRLMEISSGAYALEVDDEKFTIIDYKNGGAKRDVSSLSGGEVFIASFSLALALANHIQLKGANLELFFLDEGFGALDENLLDTVMESIEKIKSDKLSIGLISHVESIKKRLPIKLIVSPSEAGGLGSRVKMEYE